MLVFIMNHLQVKWTVSRDLQDAIITCENWRRFVLIFETLDSRLYRRYTCNFELILTWCLRQCFSCVSWPGNPWLVDQSPPLQGDCPRWLLRLQTHPDLWSIGKHRRYPLPNQILIQTFLRPFCLTRKLWQLQFCKLNHMKIIVFINYLKYS